MKHILTIHGTHLVLPKNANLGVLLKNLGEAKEVRYEFAKDGSHRITYVIEGEAEIKI